MSIDWTTQRVIVTGGAGFLGSAVVANLRARGVPEKGVFVARRHEFDLTGFNGASSVLRESFRPERPTLVIHCAGAVGGIQANKSEPGRFFYDNAAMTLNLVEAFRLYGLIEKNAVFVQVGSMTSYPETAPIPYREDDLWAGYPDAASAPYGIAKRMAWQMLDAYHRQYRLRAAYVIPCNLYGPGDNIADERNAHVAGTLVRRFVDAAASGATEVVNWGTGEPTRDFLYIDDAAEGVVRAAERALSADGSPMPINLGSGKEISIRDLSATIARLADFPGTVRWDATKPGGQPRRALDITRARALLAWEPKMALEEGLRRTIAWYRTP